MKISVVVPIYKKKLEDFEKISLKKMLTLLGAKYPVCFVCPENLVTQEYNQIINGFTNLKKIEYKKLSNTYFTGIKSYNELMLDPFFYENFKEYTYILIYQLDCYIFKDELEYWCRQGYDYIGAPFLDYKFHNLNKINKVKFILKHYIFRKIGKEISPDSIFYRAGNGGFSLRKVKKFYTLLKSFPQERKEKYMSEQSSNLRNEDTFFTYEVNRYYNRLRIPGYKTAARFSLEWNPQIGMKLNRGKLPFGCHAWHRKIEFWKKYIDELQ